MKKDIVCVITGVLTGFILGLLVKDKHKRIVQDTLSDHIDQLRKKYDDISREGKELIREGISKAKS